MKLNLTFLWIFLVTLIAYSSARAQEAVSVQEVPPSAPFANDGEIIATVSDANNGPYQFTWSIFSLNPVGEVDLLNEQVPQNSSLNNLLPGIYGLTVTNQEGCQAISTINLEACSNCLEANFTFELGYDGCSAHFTDLSIGEPSEWEWRFGDGSIVEESTPTHAFPESDCYPVTLTVWDNNGQSSSLTKEVCISGCDGDYTNNGNFNVQISGPASVYHGSYQNLYQAQVAGGVAPYEYWWQIRAEDGGVQPCGQVADQGSRETFIEIIGSQCHGNKLIVLTVNDAYGNIVEAKLPIQIVGPQPSCEMEVTGNQTVGGTVNMRILGSLLGSDCYDVYPYWTWDYGDGSPQQELFWITEHNYANPGPYQIKAIGCKEPYNIGGDCVTVLGQALIEDGTAPPSGPNFDIEPAGTMLVNIGEGLPEPLSVKVVNDLPYNEPNVEEHEYYNVKWEIFKGGTNELLAHSPSNIDVPRAEIRNGTFDDFGFTPTAEMWGCLDVRLTVTPHGYYNGKFDGNTQDGCGQEDLDGVVGNLGPKDLSEWLELTGGSDQGQYGTITGCPYPYPIINYPCKIEVAYTPLEVNDISINTGCTPSLDVTAQKGARERTSGPCGIQHYAQYAWTAYDIRNTEEEIEGLLESSNAPCASINQNHPYLSSFAGDGLLLFLAKVEVTDHFGVTESFTKVISMPPPLRISVENQISRCPGTLTPLSHNPLASGGDGFYTYTWPEHSNLVADPNHPELRLLQINNEPFNFNLTITDGTQCSQTKQIEVMPTALQADAGPEWIRICSSGPGLHLLGPDDPNQSAQGGSGKYTYDWQPAQWIDGPNDIPNPKPLADGSNWKVYTLTLSDEFGCTAQDDITVVPTNASPLAEAGDNQTICFGNPTSIGVGQTQNGYDYLWTSNNPLFKESEGATAFLLEDQNKLAGTFTYTLQAVHRSSGCYDQDQVQVTVRDQWLYQGYESQAVWSEDGAIDLWDTPVNSIIPSTNPNYQSGATPPLNFQWLPDASALQQVQYDGQGIPIEGSWYSELTDNYKTLLVSDAHNCTQSFKTNKSIRTLQTPYLEIQVHGLHGDTPYPIICGETNAELCFEVTLNTYVDTDYPQYLPPQISVDYVWRKSVGTNAQEIVEQGKIDLQLKDAQSGLYQTNKCIGPLNYTDWLSSWSDFTVRGDLNNRGYISDNWFEATYEFQVSPAGASTQAYTEVCGIWSVDKGTAAGVIYAGETHGCTTFSVAPGVRATLQGAGEDGTVYLLPNTQSPSGSRLFAFINECLTVQIPLEQSEKLDSLNLLSTTEEISNNKLSLPVVLFLRPNPFNEELEISYELYEPHQISLLLSDITGGTKKVILHQQQQEAGVYQYTLDGTPLAAGIYFLHLFIDGKPTGAKRIIKIKNN